MALSGLGRVNIASGGTPQALMPDTPAARVQKVRIQAALANAGLVYIGNSAMVTATGVGVYAVLVVPVATAGGLIPEVTFGSDVSPVGVDLSDLYIDGTTNNGVYVSFV